MIACKTKRWGNSLGLVIPHEIVHDLSLHENQEIVIEIVTTANPLKELFGFGKENKIGKKEFAATRTSFESHRF